MATETVYIVQAYVQGRGKALRAEQQVGCKDAEEARRKAERLSPLATESWMSIRMLTITR